MRRIDWTWPRSAERGRLPALVAASVALHAVVLGYMALRAFDAPRLLRFEPARQIIPLDIIPRPLLEGERRRPPTAASVQAPAPALARAAPGFKAAPVSPRSRREEDDTPQAPTGRMAAPAPAGAPAPPDGAWQVRRERLGDGVARTMRQGLPGCGMMFDRLSAAEQALCDQRFNAAAGRAAPLAGTGNPERDARFAAEGARELRRYEAMRRPLSGGTGVVGPGDCPGSNFGVGCAGARLPDVQGVDMRQGATTTHNSSQRQR